MSMHLKVRSRRFFQMASATRLHLYLESQGLASFEAVLRVRQCHALRINFSRSLIFLKRDIFLPSRSLRVCTSWQEKMQVETTFDFKMVSTSVPQAPHAACPHARLRRWDLNTVHFSAVGTCNRGIDQREAWHRFVLQRVKATNCCCWKNFENNMNNFFINKTKSHYVLCNFVTASVKAQICSVRRPISCSVLSRSCS